MYIPFHLAHSRQRRFFEGLRGCEDERQMDGDGKWRGEQWVLYCSG